MKGFRLNNIPSFSWSQCFLMMLTDPVRGEWFNSNQSLQPKSSCFWCCKSQGLICQLTNTVGWIHTNKKCNSCFCVPLAILVFKILHMSCTCYLLHLGTGEPFFFSLWKIENEMQEICVSRARILSFWAFLTLVCLAFLFSFFFFFQLLLVLDSGKLLLALKKNKNAWFSNFNVTV